MNDPSEALTGAPDSSSLRTERCRVKRHFLDRKTGKVHDKLSDVSGRRELDLGAMQAFLHLGYVPGVRTLVRDVVCLPGGARVDLLDGTWHERFRYESVADRAAFAGVPERALLHSAKQLWLDVVASLHESAADIVLPLSGGLDSRAILAALAEITSVASINTYTFGTPGSLDFEIGNQVARSVGTRHSRFDCQSVTFDVRTLRRVCELTDANTQLFRPYFVLPCLDEFGGEVSYWSGYFGDPLAGSHLPREASRSGRAAVDRYLVSECRRVKRSKVPTQLLEELRPFVEEPDGPSNRLTFDEQLDFENRQERHISNQLFFHGYRYVTPFTHERWMQLMLSQPNARRMNKRFYVELLRTGFPRFFELPVKDNLGHGLSASPWRVQVSRFKERLKRRVAPGPRVAQVNTIDYATQLRSGGTLEALVRKLTMQFCERKLIDPGRVALWWDEHTNGTQNNHWLLLNLASLEVIIDTLGLEQA